MKQLITKKMLVVALCSIIGSATYAETKPNTNTGTIRIPISLGEHHVLRPKAPSRQQIDCIYSDGNLYFSFAIPEGNCDLSLTDFNTGEIIYTDFDSEAADPVYIGEHSSAEITITTDQGNTYSGSW